MQDNLPKAYNPKEIEEKWAQNWRKNCIASSIIDKSKKPFTIVIPPPNVTGSLHMGHALNNTLQDIIIRFNKMRGFNTLWVPGTDHGGIATQNVVEKMLIAQGTSRHEVGREKFLEKMWQWRLETGDGILGQLTRLGCLLDFSRTRFTMDDVCSKHVVKAFIELFNKGLIYRGKRLVNWCPRCHTALSDIEVEHEEEIGKLWHIKYPLADGSGELIVATTRPETMLGDTAVAVNPEDERYKNLIGKQIELPLVKRHIPIVADSVVDMTFGTGAVKVTPAHDPTDFEIGLRNDLPKITVIDFHGKMTLEAGVYKGLDRYAARKKILEDLESLGLLVETVAHPHAVGRCYRCNTAIEPLISEQWFLKVEQMSQKAMEVVKNGTVKIYPDSWSRPYLLWLEKLKDWCISRQIWWGHRIPVYYCKAENSAKKCPPVASETKPEKCPHCAAAEMEQDSDVLDTWFSSALWPFSVFGENKEEADYYYPTKVLVTGHEILYLWVARMIQMGLELKGKIPFEHVFIHGIVRDKHGKKMSKSLGNVIDPLVIMEKFGTDALRFAITSAAAPGRDMQLSDESFTAARNFSNKIYNATRFVLMNIDESFVYEENISEENLELSDKWIIEQCRLTLETVTKSIENYNIDTAARAIHEFFWFKYCDWYIEIAKIRLNSQNVQAKTTVLSVLLKVLSIVLKMAHPIMPFITEEIWQTIAPLIKAKTNDGICYIEHTQWPSLNAMPQSDEALRQMKSVCDVITAIRTIRSEMNVAHTINVSVIVNSPSNSLLKLLSQNEQAINALAKVEKCSFQTNATKPDFAASAVISDGELFIPLKGLIDFEKEKARLEKELSQIKNEQERCKKNLANENFVSRAPEQEVEKMRERLREAQFKYERIKVNKDALK